MRASLLCSLLVAVAAAQTPSIDQSLSAKSVGNAEISPDGRYVAYTVQQADWDENEFVQQIWIANADTSGRYQLTSGRKSSQNPLWSPDSKRLAFISDRDGKKQIYVINPHGGEAQQLTSEDNGVAAFHWAPDGNSIAFTSTGPDAKSKKDRKEKYGDFEIIEGDYAQVHLWLVKTTADIPSDPKLRPKPELLTESDKFSVGDFLLVPGLQAYRFQRRARSRSQFW